MSDPQSPDSQSPDSQSPDSDTLEPTATTLPAKAEDDPPVVARLVVEIRSDGTRTIARGAMEDVSTGQRVGVEAKGTTPTQLAMSLAKSLMDRPLFAAAVSRTEKVRRVVKALLPKS